MIKLGGYETAISKIILSQLLYNDEKMLTIKSKLSFLKKTEHRRTRRGGWGGCSPPNFERNYHFRAIPIEIFGQFVGLSINFRSSK